MIFAQFFFILHGAHDDDKVRTEVKNEQENDGGVCDDGGACCSYI